MLERWNPFHGRITLIKPLNADKNLENEIIELNAIAVF